MYRYAYVLAYAISLTCIEVPFTKTLTNVFFFSYFLLPNPCLSVGSPFDVFTVSSHTHESTHTYEHTVTLGYTALSWKAFRKVPATSQVYVLRTTASETLGTPCSWQAAGGSYNVTGALVTWSMPKRCRSPGWKENPIVYVTNMTITISWPILANSSTSSSHCNTIGSCWRIQSL